MSRTARPATFFARLVNNIALRNSRNEGPEYLVAIDYKGNRYYEQIDGSPYVRKCDGVTLPRRWYFPPENRDEDENWDRHIPPEWEAWMRYRRVDAPTEEEVNLNLAIAHVKKLNASRRQQQEKAMPTEEAQLPKLPLAKHPDRTGDTGAADFDPYTGLVNKKKFPMYHEYEHIPGLTPGEREEKIKRQDPFID